MSKESVMSTKRASVIAAREEIPQLTRKQWEATFQEFDLKKTGNIDSDELTTMMEKMQMVPQPGEVQAMIEAVDHNGDGEISYDEFELMLVSAGRGRAAGFSHIVDRFIKMKDVAEWITSDCTKFVNQFMQRNAEHFMDLKGGAVAAQKNQTWLDIHRKFLADSELHLQHALVAWGINTEYKFEDTFLDAVQNTTLLNGFLKNIEYEAFIKEMATYVKNQELNGNGADFEAPSSARNKDRIIQIDCQLADLNEKRNALLAERRRLIGFEVAPSTTAALKHELQIRDWKDEVGLD